MIRAGSSAEVSTVAKSGDAAFSDDQNGFVPAGAAIADDVDVLQRGKTIADFCKLLPARSHR